MYAKTGCAAMLRARLTGLVLGRVLWTGDVGTLCGVLTARLAVERKVA